MAGIKFDFTGDNKNLLNAAKQAQTGVTNAISAIERAGSGIESTFSKIKGSVLGGFADIAKGMAGLTAMLQAGNFLKTLVDDAAKFNLAMKEVSTLSEDVARNFQQYKGQVVDMTTQIPIGATEAANALYQIESAGHHGADGLNVLRESAKGAIGGITDTATTADAITTILNAYKMEASEAKRVSDLLFTTVRLGKTNMSQLGTTIAQVAPVAASFGVSIEDVLAAIASLTKQGTKTSVAVRQVRDAITATTKSMGDNAFQGRSFLDAMDEVAQKAQGSNNALRQDLGTLQALNAVLSLTGKNSQAARQDVIDMQDSAGAAEAAYEKMASNAGAQTTLLRNNILKNILPMADEIRSMSGDIAKFMNEAFDSGAMDKAIVSLEAFIATYATYRGMLTATTAWNSAALGGAYQAQIAELQKLIPLKELDGQADLQAAVAKGELTIEQAKLVASLRAETEARYEEIVAAETEARSNLKALTVAEASATANLAAAEEMVVSAQARVAAATQSGVATDIETAKEELNTAEMLKNDAMRQKSIITRQREGAQTMANVTSKNAETAATLMNTTQQGVNATFTGVLATAKLHLKKAVDAVNASFLASPLFWIAATTAAVTYAVYKLVTAENAHDAAVRRANEAMDESKNKLDERRRAIDGLIRTIQDPNATAYQKARTYDELKTVAEDIAEAYSEEALASMDAANAQKILNESMEEAEFDGQEKKIAEVQEKIEAHKKTLEKWQAEYKKYANYSGYEVGSDGYDKKQGASNAIRNEKAIIENLQDELEVYQAAYDKMKAIRDQATENTKPLEIRIKEAKENETEKKRIFDFFDNVMARVVDIQSSQNNLNFDEAQRKLDAYISEIQGDLNDLHKQVQSNPLNQKLQMQEQEKTDLLNKLLQWQDEMHAGGFTTIPLMFKADWGSAQAALNAATGFYQNLLNQTTVGGAKSMADLYKAAKADYETALKEWKRVSNKKNAANVTQAEYNKAKTNLASKKTDFEAVGGDPDGKQAKAAAQAAKLARKEAEDIAKENAELRQKQFDVEMADLERQSKERDEAYNASREAYIASIKNAGERERAAEDEQHRLNIAAINKEAEEMKKANLEAAKKAWEASNTDKTKTWADTPTAKDGWKAQSLTADQEKKITAELKKEYAERDRLLKERQQKEVQSMRDYMKEFGTLQQKRLAIQQEYDDKIADETDKTQREILEAQKKQALDAFDMEVLKAEIDWTTMFDGIGNALEEEMKATLDKVEKFIQSKSFRELDAKEKAEYVKMRNELVKKTGGGVGTFDFSIYHQIGEDMKAYQQAIRDAKIAQANHTAAVNDFKVADAELKEAEKNLAKAMNNIASNPQAAEDANRVYLDAKGKQQMADMVAKITGKKQDEAEGNVIVAQGNLTDSTTKAKQALDNFGDAISQMTSGSLRGFADGLVNLIAAIGGKNGNGLSGLGKAGGIIGAILSIIDAIGSNEEGLSGVVAEIIDKIVNVITSLIDKITNGDFFRDINTAVGEGIQKILEHLFNSISDIISNHVEAWRDAFNGNFGSGFQEGFGVGGFFGKIFGERDDEKTYAEIQEEISDRIEEANKALDRLTEQLEKSYGVDAINKAEEAQRQLQKNQSDMIKGLDAALWDNYGGGESDYRKWNRFGRDEGIIANLMQKYGLKSSDMSWNALFNENSADEIARMLDDIRNTDFDLWSRFKSAGYNEGAVREWMEQLADTVKESDDIQKALEEKLTTTTKDNVIDDFKESLYDLADGSEDATEEIAENWQKMVNRMVVDNLVMKSMQADLEKWYDDLVALQKKRTNGEIGDKEYKEQLETLKGNYQGIVNGAYASIEVFKKERIIKPIEDADNEVKEYFENLKDSWKSALADMTKTGKDWKNELIDQVLDDLVESSVMQAPFDAMIDGAEKHFDTFLLYLDDWNKRYKDVIEDQKLTDEERTAKLKKLIDEQSDAYDTQAAKSKKLAEGIGKDMTEAFSNSLDNLGDTLLDALLDTEKDAKQLGKEIGQTLAKEMLAEMLASEKYATKKEDIRKLWQNVLKSENGKWTDMEGVFGEAGLVYTIDEVLAKITELNDAIVQDEDIDKMAKKYQEWGKTLEDISTSFGNLHDSIMNSILDMENGIEDFANDMNQKLVKDLIEKQVFGKPIDITWQNEAYHLDNYEKYQENWTKRYNDIYNDVKLSEEERERLLQALVDEMIAQEKILNDAAEDFAKRYQKAKKDTTFTDMKDSFIDSLMDMEGSIEDFAKNMKETIIRHLIEGFMVSDKIKPMFDDLQKTFDYMMSQKGWTDQQRLDFMTKGGQDNEGKAYRGIDDYTEEWKAWKSTVDGMLSYYGLVKKETDELLSSITSNLNSMLTDSEKTGKDFASSLKESVINSLIDAYTTTEDFQDKLAEVKKQMKEAIESGNPAKIEAAERAAENFYKTAAAGVKMYTDALDQAEQEQETIFDNMRDSFRNSIMDMTKTGKDFAQDLKKTFTEEFVDKFVMGEAFDKVMQDFEDDYLKIMGNKSLSKEERAEQGKQIIAAAQKYYEAQKAEAKTLGDLMGINSKEDQSAYMNTAQSFTYDQADLIGGMVTSILMGQTEGNKVRQEILATLRAMDGITNPNSEVFAEMSENISRSANYLSHIEQAVSRIDTAVARNAAAVTGILSKLS